MARTPAIGIDLGTTYSCVGVVEKGVQIISNSLGNQTTPSVVAFNNKNECLIGELAKESHCEASVIFGSKRLIGRRFTEDSVKEDIQNFPFKVVNHEGFPVIEPDVLIQGERMQFFPEEISAMILREMKEQMHRHLGRMPKEAVITVPAYFSDSQRQATIDAASIAGLSVLRLLSEPTAAAIAYCSIRADDLPYPCTILVFDLGGGTFDISILKIIKEKKKFWQFGSGSEVVGEKIEVLGVGGDTHLGGEDFDVSLMNHVLGEIKRKHGVDPPSKFRDMYEIRLACERAKHRLSTAQEATITVTLGHRTYYETVSREIFEFRCTPLFQKAISLMDKTLRDVGLANYQLDEIILVGGSTRIPKVQELLKKYFGRKELAIREIQQDLAVATGAAILAAKLSDGKPGLTLNDVTPLTLGIEDCNGNMIRFIERNSKIPCKVEKSLTPQHTSPTSVGYYVYEGERTVARENNLLGHFVMKNIPQPTDRTLPKLKTTFEIDENGILKVTAVETIKGQSNSIVIAPENRSRHSKIAIARMIANADRFRADDEKKVAAKQAKNALELYIFKLRIKWERDRLQLTCSNFKIISEQLEKADQWMKEHGHSADRDTFNSRLVELRRACCAIVGDLDAEPTYVS